MHSLYCVQVVALLKIREYSGGTPSSGSVNEVTGLSQKLLCWGRGNSGQLSKVTEVYLFS